jgi:predicted short-subunit dehydrogenase-like oxidoreductase (DUF2520 family)
VSPACAVVGTGRAGGAFATALAEQGWQVRTRRGTDDLAGLDTAGELVLLCVPDGAVAEVARRLTPSEDRVVAHCAGSLGLGALAGHPRAASVHPLVSLADAASGARRLRGAWFAVAGDPVADEVVAALGGRAVRVDDERRAAYHAAAAVASNHLVALLGQVQRIADGAGVPLEAYLDLARGSIDNVADRGPAAALTGPVARGDWDTVRAHLAAIDPDERAAYVALAAEAARLVGRPLPADWSGAPGVDAMGSVDP